MKFGELMRQTLSKKTGIAGLVLCLGGMGGVFCLAGSAQSVPPFVVMLLAFVSMAGTRILTVTMNRVRMENAGKE